ncbi:MAG: UDP-3-O-(3-hydroxymyristoyl)glucosamine N-acyltransferase, partial [Gammaproteobacteria bacterium]|nr:UDP-3-O-(3-hydroxymyristoyl)glucosamine N-acyltransferase [Gammaproteobacteria bacterium]
MKFSLAELSVRFGCDLRGDPDVEISRVGTLQAADEGCLSFLANAGYRGVLAATRASAVVLAPADSALCPTNALITASPYAVYAGIAQLLHPPAPVVAGIHPRAIIAPGSDIPATCEIGPGAVIGERVRLGENVIIGPNCILADGVRIGDDTRLVASVTVYHDVELGARCLVHAGTTIGSDGFGMAPGPAGWIKVPQVGGVKIGDDVEIGANCCIDRGAIEDTVIGNDVKLDNLVQIAHNVVIGDHTAIAGQSGVAGSARIGARCMIGGSVAVSGHLEIVDDVNVMGRGSV